MFQLGTYTQRLKYGNDVNDAVNVKICYKKTECLTIQNYVSRLIVL